MARDIFLTSDLRTEQDAINDTRSIDGQEQTVQQAVIITLRTFHANDATALTATELSRLEQQIRNSLTAVDEIGSVDDVSITDVTDNEVSVSVSTGLVDFERPFTYPT